MVLSKLYLEYGDPIDYMIIIYMDVGRISGIYMMQYGISLWSFVSVLSRLIINDPGFTHHVLKKMQFPRKSYPG